MTAHQNITELRNAVSHLLALLDNPHPGLISWHLAYGKALENVAKWHFTPEQWAKIKGASNVKETHQ